MKVLLGIGGGEDGFRALSRTIERARTAGHDLTIAVVENPETDADPGTLEERVHDEVDEAGIDAEVRRLPGDPGTRLVEVAEDEEFDEIAIGGGEYSPMGKVSLGPVAQFVVLNAQVTVVLVR